MLSVVGAVATAVVAASSVTRPWEGRYNEQYDRWVIPEKTTLVSPAAPTEWTYSTYLGIGRLAKVNHVVTNLACGATAQISIGYQAWSNNAYVLDVHGQRMGKNKNMTAEEACNVPEYCVAGRTFVIENPYGEKITCVKKTANPSDGCTSVLGNGEMFLVSGVPTTLNWNSGVPFYAKSHGEQQYKFFIVVTVSRNSACTPAQNNNLFVNARAKNPEDNSCVAPQDPFSSIEEKNPIQYSTPEAAQIRQPNRGFVRETVQIQSLGKLGLPNATNYHAFDLGTSPAIELGCVHVHMTATHRRPECSGYQYGSDMRSPTPGRQFQGRVSLVETYPCNVHTSSEFGTSDGRDFILPPGLFGADEVSRYRYTSCCSQTTAATCHSVGPKDQSAATRDQFCIWSESAGCLPLFSSSKKTLDGFVGLGQKDSKTTFLSSKVNVPKSSLIATHRYLDQGFQVVNDRKWLLVVDTPTREVSEATLPTCMISATVSYTKSNTGGICEPSTRRMCDARETSCSLKTDTTSLAVWWWGERGDDEFHTCNCLKQKEVCYRKNGCLSTKKYELILQNCLEAGCGTVCNSAGVVHLSVTVALIALLAILL
eukprot:Rhum_TRINITY_DN14226_c13_g32::Rhum_TRINITY_DN14226_c13_g32_i1::g.75953::m.75953